MPSFKNFEKNLEGATRGQSFLWEVYGILWSNLPPHVFGKLAVNSQCSSQYVYLFVLKTIAKEKLKYL